MKRDSSPDFFNSGMTTASFQQSGKIPDSNELLIMLVITEISDSLQDFSKCVGMGSRQQEVDLEFAMSTRTSSSANSSIKGFNTSRRNCRVTIYIAVIQDITLIIRDITLVKLFAQSADFLHKVLPNVKMWGNPPVNMISHFNLITFT